MKQVDNQFTNENSLGAIWKSLFWLQKREPATLRLLSVDIEYKFNSCAWVCPEMGFEPYKDPVTFSISPRIIDSHKIWGWVERIRDTKDVGNYLRQKAKKKKISSRHCIWGMVGTNSFSIIEWLLWFSNTAGLFREVMTHTAKLYDKTSLSKEQHFTWYSCGDQWWKERQVFLGGPVMVISA